MVTVVEPQNHIIALWSRLEDREDKAFRLMSYVMRVDYINEVLLHNVVTGQLVLLNQEEAEVLDQLPRPYSRVMKKLVDGHFLVPEEFDEHRYVVKIRKILRMLDVTQKRIGFQHYIILPTTSCNARCYYCFEQGVKHLTMTKETADDVVNFIVNHCGSGKKVSIMWFGGEPTIATNRIDQISTGLRNYGINYSSTMVSNAYLFDEEMVSKAKNLWELKRIQISVDGIEEKYNRVKNYVYTGVNPYERIMRNIDLFINHRIQVDLRMNFDLNNYMDFELLLNEVAHRFKRSDYLQVYAYPVIGEYSNREGIILHGDDEWRAQTSIKLNNMARDEGLYRHKDEVPYLKYNGCGADTDHSITINSQGYLVECPEHFEENEMVGTVKDGIMNYSLVQTWKEIADIEKCRHCTFFPRCLRLKKCSAGDSCYFQDRNQQYYETVKRKFSSWATNNTLTGGKKNDL